jgi:hypothetical protein
MKIIIELSGTTTTIENKDAENIHEAFEMFRCALLGAGYSQETIDIGFALLNDF